MARRPIAALVGALALVAAAPPAGSAATQAVDVRNDVEYGTANGKRLMLDAYIPAAGEGRRPAVIMIHGGGWRVGDKASWQPEAERLAAKGWVAFSINYRLDERVVFPAEIDDVQAAVSWVRANAAEYGVDTTRIAALGESAGGHLAAMLATLGRAPLHLGSRIRVGAAWSPPVDFTTLAGARGDGWAAQLFGCTQATCADLLARSSPVNHVDESDAPLYLANSTEELVPLSQAQSMAEKLKAAGVEHRLDVFPGNRHALDFRDDAWAPTVAFLDEHLSGRTVHDREESSMRTWIFGAGLGVALVLVAGRLSRRRR